MVATDFRLQEWATQIKECQNRPQNMKVEDWCAAQGITKGNYYYRLRRVREACLSSLPQSVVPVPEPVMMPVHEEGQSSCLDITVDRFQIHVSQSTSMQLLSSVLKVLADVK